MVIKRSVLCRIVIGLPGHWKWPVTVMEMLSIVTYQQEVAEHVVSASRACFEHSDFKCPVKRVLSHGGVILRPHRVRMSDKKNSSLIL